MRLALLAALGGAAGTVARYAAISTAARVLGPGFPWGTFGVNVTGSFAIGVCVAVISHWFGASSDLRTLLVTGFLGGFTTFSAYSLDTLELIERREFALALAYAGGSVAASLLAVFLGFAAVRTITS